MAQPRQVSEEVRKWSRLPWVPPDGKHNRQFAVEASAPQLEALIRQPRTAYQALGLFGPEHCAGDPFKLDYEGKVLVLEEFIQGDTLDFLLKAAPLSPKATREIIIQLCQALNDTLYIILRHVRQTGHAGTSGNKSNPHRSSCNNFLNSLSFVNQIR